MKIKLSVISGDSDCEEGLREARKIPGAEITLSMCPPSAKELFSMPILRIKGGVALHGLDDIRDFVQNL